MPILHVGFDDTDSKKGMCTTYIGAVIVGRLEEIGVGLDGLPRLIRLNPNWTLKTRGNCSIALTLKVDKNEIPVVKRIVLDTVAELAELHVETTNPGVAFFEDEKIPDELKKFSRKVIQDVVTLEEAEELAGKLGVEIHKFKMGRGIIGGLAAIGETLEEDRTFELVAYRMPENWGSERRVDEKSVFEMNGLTFPKTFDNLDPVTKEIRITPHTPCPVLYGIRGESIEATLEAHNLVRVHEPVERWLIYRTNQATDAHLRKAKISEVKPYWSVVVEGVVSEKPKTIAGGHVIFRIRDESGEIDCAAYEPTRQFRTVVRKLDVGDMVKVYGGVKEKPELPLTINLEKIAVLKLKPHLRRVNPTCRRCGKRTKSAGKNKGFICKKCKLRFTMDSAKYEEVPREIGLGLYEVPPRARRHLAMPFIRVSQEERTY